MQKTVAREIKFKGRGIHTGIESQIVIKPGAVSSGVVFVRIDQDPPVHIPANIDYIQPGAGGRQTCLGTGKVFIRTIEHLMAVFHGLGIDNVVVEVTSDELPGFDGSAQEFVKKVQETGLVTQNAPRRYLTLTEPIFLDEGDRSLIALPYDKGLKLSYTLSYQHRDLKDQYFSSDVTPQIFEKELASARTFCLKEEADSLKAAGYGQGASLENTLVFENDVPIKNTLRYANEACRHKTLDLLGDLYLAGAPLKAHIVACRTGHGQNMKLVARIKESMKKGKSSLPTNGKKDLSTAKELDVTDIQQILPHRHPFLLVDKIIELVPGQKAVGIKCVTINEDFFRGHFPGHPVMPGVLILEALAQVGGVLMLSQPENQGKIAYFMTIENAKFRQPVRPGDQLRLEAEVLRIKSRTGQCSGKAYVDGKLVCEAEVKFALVDS